MDGSALLVSFIISLVGYGMFRYGRSISRAPPLVGGLVMMGFPYFLSSVWLSLAIAVGIVAATWAAMRYVG